MSLTEYYMKRCLELAKKGIPSTRPNPSVGAVLVYKNRIIGEGFTSPFGGSHGEVNCINSVVNKDLISKSTLYVSLEPCSHTGKTPPCADLIVKSHIPKVVIGCVDTFSEVAGKGIARLRESGIEVEVGILENECREMNKRFFTFYEKNRPYIFLKWAQTLDGFIAPSKENHNQDRWISGTQTNQFTHRLRANEMAILVGKNTVLTDNPSLSTRNFPGKNPVRIVIDKKLESWMSHQIFNIYNTESETLLINESSTFKDKKVEGIEMDFSRNILPQLMELLVIRNIQSLIVEGGSQTLQSFIDMGLWDEVFVITGKKKFVHGTKAPRFDGHIAEQFLIESDEVKRYKNSNS